MDRVPHKCEARKHDFFLITPPPASFRIDHSRHRILRQTAVESRCKSSKLRHTSSSSSKVVFWARLIHSLSPSSAPRLLRSDAGKVDLSTFSWLIGRTQGLNHLWEEQGSRKRKELKCSHCCDAQHSGLTIYTGHTGSLRISQKYPHQTHCCCFCAQNNEP